MSDRRRLDINAIREAHEPFDNGCCCQCGIPDCDVMLLLAEVEQLRADLSDSRHWAKDTVLRLAEVEQERDFALGGEQ